ncbi:MAG: hypothetical protein FJY81_07130 [Candidatus Aminicenantes bacterium]|nr:hypothetical protein [Candidatus Aminicenantes bacterium]
MWREAIFLLVFGVTALVLVPACAEAAPVPSNPAGWDQEEPLDKPVRIGGAGPPQQRIAVGSILRTKKEEKTGREEEKEAEGYLLELERQRDTLVGDFFGINITARRYDMVFDRLGYIRYRIKQVDEEILRVKAFLRH